MKNIYSIGFLVLFFSLKSFAQHQVLFESSPNFRTFSGIENYEGKKVKNNIYRSGSFSKLSNKEKQIFNSLKINTIVDFRNDFEIAKEPDYVPEESNIVVKNAPIGNVSKSMKGFMEVMAKPNFSSKDADSLMIVANKNFVENINDFKPFFEALQNDNSLVLFHCTAGKDRTGLAASLFLHLLDVPFDAILNDYLKSNEAVQFIDEEKLAMYGMPVDRMKMLMGVKAEYLEAAWNALIASYGTLDAMLFKEFGIDDTAKQKLKNKYLVD